MRFAVLVVESLPTHLRGFSSRFLQEVSTGVYVGVVSERVADALWDSLAEVAIGSAVLVVSDPTADCGYTLRAFGPKSLEIVDFDGLIMPVKFRRFPDLG